MFHPVESELWLRRSCRFEVCFDSDFGDGAAWIMGVSPSEHPPSQICLYPGTLMYFCRAGRGVIEFSDGHRFVLDSGERQISGQQQMRMLRVPANTRHIMRNELRDEWRLDVVMLGNTGAESFLDALGMTSDEDELLKQAHAVGMDLFLPDVEAQKPVQMVAAETRISYPMGLGFSL